MATAIEHMRKHPTGDVFTAADFARLGDFGPHWSTYLAPALKHKLIERAIGSNGLPTGYRLTVCDQFEADELRGGKPLQIRSDAKDAQPIGAVGPSSVFALAGEPPPTSGFKRWLANRSEDSAEGTPRRKRLPPAPAAPTTEIIEVPKTRPLCCALFNTGDLVVEIPGAASLRLDPMQVADLVRYLKRVHPEFGVVA